MKGLLSKKHYYHKIHNPHITNERQTTKPLPPFYGQPVMYWITNLPCSPFIQENRSPLLSGH